MRETAVTPDNLGVRTTSLETSSIPTSDERKIRTQARDDGNSSTAKPVIVWVSVPERRRNLDKDRGKFAMKNPFVSHVDDNVNLHDIGPPKTDYVKNIHKGAYISIEQKRESLTFDFKRRLIHYESSSNLS